MKRQLQIIEGRGSKIPLRRVNDALDRADRSIAYKVGAASALAAVTLCGIAFFVVSPVAKFAPGAVERQTAAPPSADKERLDNPEATAKARDRDVGGGVSGLAHDAGDGAKVTAGIDERKAREVWLRRLRIGTLAKGSEPVFPSSTETQAPNKAIVALPSQALTELALDKVVSRQQTAAAEEQTADASQIAGRSSAVENGVGCLGPIKKLAAESQLLFEKGSAEAPLRQSQKIKPFVEAVLRCPQAKIDVGGHTDQSGEALSNLQLSWQRAENAIASIARMGFDTAQFTPFGYGARRPLTAGSKKETQALNRRVDFTIR